jgi:hypothetical protein
VIEIEEEEEESHLSELGVEVEEAEKKKEEKGPALVVRLCGRRRRGDLATLQKERHTLI